MRGAGKLGRGGQREGRRVRFDREETSREENQRGGRSRPLQKCWREGGRE